MLLDIFLIHLVMEVIAIILGIAVIILAAILVTTSKKCKKAEEDVIYYRNQLLTVEKQSVSRNAVLSEATKALKATKLKGFEVAGMKASVKIIDNLREI